MIFGFAAHTEFRPQAEKRVRVLLVAGGGVYAKRVKSAFFPKDLSYLSYVDIWLPEDATLGATRGKAIEVGRVSNPAAHSPTACRAAGRAQRALRSRTVRGVPFVAPPKGAMATLQPLLPGGGLPTAMSPLAATSARSSPVVVSKRE